jgi:hypothetical protein
VEPCQTCPNNPPPQAVVQTCPNSSSLLRVPIKKKFDDVLPFIKFTNGTHKKKFDDALPLVSLKSPKKLFFYFLMRILNLNIFALLAW